jgi:excisionase family DNA binding protein
MTYLTIEEAAELLRVKVSWLYERTRLNEIPHTKLGKYLRFDRDELMAWVEQFRRDGRGPRHPGDLPPPNRRPGERTGQPLG